MLTLDLQIFEQHCRARVLDPECRPRNHIALLHWYPLDDSSAATVLVGRAGSYCRHP